MLSDGTNSFAFNGEGELASAAGVTYTYDGDGNRVKKSSGKLYWYGGTTDPLSESDASGNLTDEYVFFGGARIARRDASNNVDYYFADQLGSAHVVTNSSGAIQDDSDYYPFGGERSYTSSSGNTYKFTGKERDSESGLDDFAARFYTSSLGRFLSPDDSKYVKAADPQTWNLYSYVANNPLNAVDPTGHMLNPMPYQHGNSPGEEFGVAADTQVKNGQPKTKTTASASAAGAGLTDAAKAAANVGATQSSDEGGIGTRIVQGGEAILNGFIAWEKINAAVAVEVGSGGFGTAGAAYIALSGSGNAATAGIQMIGATTGKTQEAAQMAKIPAVMTSVSGFSTFLYSKNLDKAASAANYEGIFTTSPSKLIKGGFFAVGAKVIDFAESVFKGISDAYRFGMARW